MLITGESGTGKELVAETVHANSDRAKHPFIKVNCAAFAENLLESELFGHEKGAFTGAERQRDGLFSQADGGTLFLDEIGETSLAMQVKLLRTLQEGEVQRVGGDQPVTVDVRIIAATNRNLLEQVEQGRFREDLYYRLNVVTLEIAPLRDRGDDIVLLAHHFAAGYAEKNRRSFTSLTPECRQVLTAYSWPGNVRELQNSMERGIILMRGEQLTEKSLPLHIQREAQAKTIVDPRPAATLQEAEKALILQHGGADGNKAKRPDGWHYPQNPS